MYIYAFVVDTFCIHFLINKISEVFTIASKEKDLQINDEIRSGQMLVIGPKGEQLGVKTKTDALTLADYAGFDLVLINESSNPPVAKLMDYKKYKYEKKKKQKENDKKQKESSFEIKEYRLSVTIDKHDFETKMNNARKQLEKGNKIKASIRFKGRQLAHTELGEEVLKRFAEGLSDISVIETQPKFEFKTIFMVLTPKKDK